MRGYIFIEEPSEASSALAKSLRNKRTERSELGLSQFKEKFFIKR